METTKIENLNQKFKSNALLSGIVNLLILGLVLVFFSIGFDLTKNLFLAFISVSWNLSWSSIFPSIVDLVTVAGLIAILKNFVKILKSPDFLLHLEDRVEGPPLQNEKQPHILNFLKNDICDKFFAMMIGIIGLFLFNCLFNSILEGINDKLSPINEAYLLSTAFTHLPIFPINLVNIFVLMVIILPTTLNYKNYQLQIAEIFDVQSEKINKKTIKFQVDDIKGFRCMLFIFLALICILLSIMQSNNVWIFQYNKPINDEKILAEKLTDKASAFCEENFAFNTIHQQNVLTLSMHTDSITKTYNYPITPELKQLITVKCEKRAEEDKKEAAKKLEKQSKTHESQ